MQEDNKTRVHRAINLFAGFTTVASLLHFVVLEFSLKLAGQLDDIQHQQGDDRSYNFWQNLPFAITLGVFAVLQFCSALSILIFNNKDQSVKTLYYSSLIGMLVSFSIGVQLTILAEEYNSFTRTFPKNTDQIPSLMTFYWICQVDATASLLFMFPMMAFTFYRSVQSYLKQQREQNPEQPASQSNNIQGWLLTLFLLHTLAQVVFVYNLYEFSTKEDRENYNLDNIIDGYAYFIEVGVIVSLVTIILQMKNFVRQFISKRQVILLAVVTGLFQMGSFILMAIKTAQFFIEIYVMEKDKCYFEDCDQANRFKWQILGYTILNLVALLGQIPYLRSVSTKFEKNEQRDTLMTTEQHAAA